MKKDDVVTIVLINGAEIVGRFVVDNGKTVVLNKPRMIQASEQGIGLVPGICMTGEEPSGDFEFNKSGVLFIINTVEQLANQYGQMTSGLIMPQTKGLI
jgi:hypothetical protein